MDLIPKPDQVVAAAGNLAHMVLYGGLADLRPMPRTLIDEGPLREVYHYRPARQVKETGDPVLLVTPLAAPSLCYDLRRGCSLVEHFVNGGRPTYLVEYGEISFQDRNLGMEHWIRDVVPTAIREVSEHAGGRPVHLVGWSLGGIFSVLVAASNPTLPIASLTVVGSPFDVSQVPLVAPLRPILRLTDAGLITPLYRMMGGAPKPLVRRAFQLTSGTKLLTKPVARLVNLDDREWLAQIEAVDRFTRNMIAYPGRSFGQLYHRMVRKNQLREGVVEYDGREIRVDSIRLPVLVFAGNTDGIAPINSVRALLPLLPNAAEVRFEIVPGGHLGMLTGRAARETTWVVLDEWLAEHSTPEHLTPEHSTPGPPARKKPTGSPGPARRTTNQPSKRAAPKKSASKKAASKKAASKKAASSTRSGSNTGEGATKQVAPKKTAPKKTAPKKAESVPTTGQAAPNKAAPNKAAPNKTAPNKTAPNKAAPKRAAPESAATTGTATGKTTGSTRKTAPKMTGSAPTTAQTAKTSTRRPPAGGAGRYEPAGQPEQAGHSDIGTNPQRRYSSGASRNLGRLPRDGD